MVPVMALTKSKIERNLRRVQENIRAACDRARRDADEVSLVAVTKTVDVEVIGWLVDLGVADLGESRAQQLVPRTAELADLLARRKSPPASAPRWHMIGHLQRNKVKAALDCAEMIHSVDSLRLAEEISERAGKLGRSCRVLLQVNCSAEAQKSGVAVGAATHMGGLVATLPNIRLCGLMTMAQITDDPELARPAFVRLRELFEEMRGEKIGGEEFQHLSMGMSQDYQVAVEEGATLIRVGSALFEE